MQLAHQIGFVVQAPGGVDQQNVAALGAGLLEGFVGEPRGVAAGRPGTTRQPVRSPQICSCSTAGGAERVAGGEHDLVAGVPVLLGELGDRRRLAAAVDPDDENDEGLFVGVEAQRLHDRLDEPDHLLGQSGADLLGRDLLVEPGPPQLLGDLGGDAEPHIAGDQQLFELEQRLVVEAAAVEDRIDAFVEPRRAARHPRPQPPEPAAALLAVGGLAAPLHLVHRQLRPGLDGAAAPNMPLHQPRSAGSAASSTGSAGGEPSLSAASAGGVSLGGWFLVSSSSSSTPGTGPGVERRQNLIEPALR